MTTTYAGNAKVSRRIFLIGGAAAGSLLPAEEASARVKLSKAAVRFGAPSADGRDCRSCKLFVAPSSCMFVEGATEPNGFCWIWSRKTA
ncbi:hypothetical protein GJ654_08140 [Rhodoblastus acidophilus]|uniref:HiPIP n=1 Tax=Rhodoblastus acidophilus TaxID=1074 RepID=A0A6N8DP39_RHOAC|nr:hypothetical protein [Rhodoblastus acidophilus]MCW2273894.1 hypothetical protein [Rhodoblastus acidophilus]MTV30963.1 hypothetical protein [Rhodoblastus acidophilus]